MIEFFYKVALHFMIAGLLAMGGSFAIDTILKVLKKVVLFSYDLITKEEQDGETK